LGVALFAIVLLITKRASSKTTVPFGPFIIIGSWLAVLLLN
jgi:prepilin signal peptidase PulO-like enzyme (type II secretory pathway)